MFNSLTKMRQKTRAVFSGVTDIIVVEQEDGNLTSTPFNLKFGKLKFLNPLQEQFVEVYNTGEATKTQMMSLIQVKLFVNTELKKVNFYLDEDQTGYFGYEDKKDIEELEKARVNILGGKQDSQKEQEYQLIQQLQSKLIVLSKTPIMKTLKELNLKEGKNEISYEIECKKLGKQNVDCQLFLCKQDTKIFISDIDGTVTKSPTIGMLLSTFGRDYTQNHICNFYNKLQEKGYLILYMSARSMVQYESTKEYLMRQEQDGIKLPAGPVFLSTSELLEAFTVEIIKKQTDILKSRMLNDLAQTIGVTGTIRGGIGDRMNDIQAYRMANVSYDRIFLINKKGEILRVNEKGENTLTNIPELIQNMDLIF